MIANHSAFGLNEAFGPDDLRILASAFDSALDTLDPGEAAHLSPHAIRQILAKGIIDLALTGERDPDRLREGALDSVRAAPPSVQSIHHARSIKQRRGRKSG